MRSHRLDALWAFAVASLAFSGTAHAYIDPGTGSLALQMALAALFACLFAVRASWTKVRGFFGHLLHSHGATRPGAGARRP